MKRILLGLGVIVGLSVFGQTSANSFGMNPISNCTSHFGDTYSFSPGKRLMLFGCEKHYLIPFGLAMVNDSTSYSLMPENSNLSMSMRRDSVLFSFIQNELRSPTKAFLIAFLPGSVVHGAGHFYAKKPKTGRILLGVQGAGMLFTFFGWVGAYGPWLVEETPHAEEKIKIGKVLFYSGITLFAGSWIYDMIGAPLQAKAHNKKIMQRYGLSLKIQPQKNEIKLILVKNF